MNEAPDPTPTPTAPSVTKVLGSLLAFAGGFFAGLVVAFIASLFLGWWINGSPRPAWHRTVALYFQIVLLAGIAIAWARTLRSRAAPFMSGVLVGAALAFLVCATCFGLLR